MKAVVLSCLLFVVVVVCDHNYRKCQDKDPFSCGITCGPNEVHACIHDYCACVRGDNMGICKHCGAVLKTESGLRQHEQRHVSRGPYKCCGQPFFSRANLKRHRCNKHGEAKQFRCDTCQKTFPTNTDLRRHIRSEKKDWSFTCKICKQTFPSKEKLSDHEDKHDGQKRHSCGICGRTYRYQSNLSRHMNIHKDT